MLTFPNIDKVAFQIGSFPVYWYGISYLLAFVLAYVILLKRVKRYPEWNADFVSDLIFYGTLGVMLGGRIGYTFLYNVDAFIDNPMVLFKVREGGMSFHGGFLGVVIAISLFCYNRKIHPFKVLDFIAPAVPLGLMLGRIANFINGELYGRATSSEFPFAMIFPTDPESLPRHPSQLYQAIGEGLLLFIVLWIFTLTPKPRFAVSGLFLIGYGIARFMTEFVREPDAGASIFFGWMTKGQLYTIPMLVAGIYLIWKAYHQKVYDWQVSAR